MERARRTRSVRSRTSTNRTEASGKTTVRTVKLVVCASIFAMAALLKVLFPGAITYIGDKVTAAVDYKSALAVLGEGISGEKKFMSAVGEAFVYAFRPETEDAGSFEKDVSSQEKALETFIENEEAGGQPEDVSANIDDEAVAEEEVRENDLSNAIISAFLRTQEGFSDYALPSGTTFEMPMIGISFTKPLEGPITSSFGYRNHPVDGQVKFHYGTDMAAAAGSEIVSVADGNVTAVGESATLGKYIIISHGNIISQYAHCSEVFVSSGQAVTSGERIAAVGDTGNATSTCLHFELKVDDVFVNPEYYIVFV